MIDAVSHAYANEYANVHRGLHFLSNAATDAYENAREIVKRFLNAPSVDNVVFTKSTTEAINAVAYGYGMPHIKDGDEIVITIMEHHSNIVPWHFLRERQGAKIVWVGVDDQGNFDLDDFRAALTDRTKLVAITHMSNVLGTVVDVKEVCRIAHERGVKVLVDGSQAAVHMPVDVQDIDCDWYAMTGHKLYGPSGIGALYGKTDALKSMQPFMGGGEMIVDVSEDSVTYSDPPHRFEAGTPPIVQAIGLGASLEYMEKLGRDRIAAHEADLATYAAEKLSAVNALRLIGTARGKGAIFAFELEGIHAHDVSMLIDRSGVAVRAGTHCAQPLLKRFGATSTCRASMGLYNTRAEIDVLVEALDKARAFFG
ncbi:MAG: cysteine desulfurase, partial [Hoeflea sp.]|nr:cysteine desulfurase [Hoeflea sp.]